MLRSLLSTSLILLGTSWALAVGPSAGPPTQQLVQVDATGGLQVYYQSTVCYPVTQTRTVQEKVPTTETYTVEVNGKIEQRTRTVYQTITRQQSYTVMKSVCAIKMRNAQLDQMKAFETNGSVIPTNKLKDRLSKNTLAVVSANSEMIPDYYAVLFKPGTVILAFEREVVPQPPAAPMVGTGFSP